MKEFIADRAKTTFLKKRIHAIWYCIPMDKLDRAIQRSEEMFFAECNPGNIPIVVLFTKFDALVPVALGKLAPADRQLPIQERLLKAKLLIDGIFDRADVWGRLSKMTYPPKSCVRIEGLHRSNEGCNSLLENTAAVLSEEALQMLLVSAQETNIALCVSYAAKWMIHNVEKAYRSAFPLHDMGKVQLHFLALWFPHLKVSSSWWSWEWWWDLDMELVDEHHTSLLDNEAQLLDSNTQRKFATWKQILQAGVDAILILEHSFYLSELNDPQPVSTAAKKYIASNTPISVGKALKDVLKQYNKASEEDKVAMVLNVVIQNRMATPVAK